MTIVTPQEAALTPEALIGLGQAAKLCLQCICNMISTFASATGNPGASDYFTKLVIEELRTIQVTKVPTRTDNGVTQ